MSIHNHVERPPTPFLGAPGPVLQGHGVPILPSPYQTSPEIDSSISAVASSVFSSPVSRADTPSLETLEISRASIGAPSFVDFDCVPKTFEVNVLNDIIKNPPDSLESLEKTLTEYCCSEQNPEKLAILNHTFSVLVDKVISRISDKEDRFGPVLFSADVKAEVVSAANGMLKDSTRFPVLPPLSNPEASPAYKSAMKMHDDKEMAKYVTQFDAAINEMAVDEVNEEFEEMEKILQMADPDDLETFCIIKDMVDEVAVPYDAAAEAVREIFGRVYDRINRNEEMRAQFRFAIPIPRSVNPAPRNS